MLFLIIGMALMLVAINLMILSIKCDDARDTLSFTMSGIIMTFASCKSIIFSIEFMTKGKYKGE